jgi:hypothetical protein
MIKMGKASRNKRHRTEATPCTLRTEDTGKNETGPFSVFKGKAAKYAIIAASAVGIATAGYGLLHNSDTGLKSGNVAKPESTATNAINTRFEVLLRPETKDIEVQVKAIPQDCEASGYAINVRTDNNYWYQLVLSYRKNEGFDLECQSWDGFYNTTLSRIRNFAINQGDTVDLAVSLSDSGNVDIRAQNLNNPEPAFTAEYTNVFAKSFVVDRDKSDTTSIMSEIWTLSDSDIAKHQYTIIEPAHVSEACLRFSKGIMVNQLLPSSAGPIMTTNTIRPMDAQRTDWYQDPGQTFTVGYSASTKHFSAEMK